ncbi:type II 3-dehydroquinate dehydratase [Phyllobacterium zundukense]|uniref:type II 3-dehydroquinate dehydratase n=1 Tax=Phyllobacterium zundukense TaxID=1867719 RepID=UPI003965ADF9
MAVDLQQTDYEGTMVNYAHEAWEQACGAIINGAGSSFTSIALAKGVRLRSRKIFHQASMWVAQ